MEAVIYCEAAGAEVVAAVAAADARTAAHLSQTSFDNGIRFRSAAAAAACAAAAAAVSSCALRGRTAQQRLARVAILFRKKGRRPRLNGTFASALQQQQQQQPTAAAAAVSSCELRGRTA